MLTANPLFCRRSGVIGVYLCVVVGIQSVWGYKCAVRDRRYDVVCVSHHNAQ